MKKGSVRKISIFITNDELFKLKFLLKNEMKADVGKIIIDIHKRGDIHKGDLKL
jgi:hypothetical protein